MLKNKANISLTGLAGQGLSIYLVNHTDKFNGKENYLNMSWEYKSNGEPCNKT